MVLAVNSDYFLKQRYPFDVCNCEVLCSFLGTNRILTCYLYEFGFKYKRLNLGGGQAYNR
jgi:hypothetical protein